VKESAWPKQRPKLSVYGVTADGLSCLCPSICICTAQLFSQRLPVLPRARAEMCLVRQSSVRDEIQLRKVLLPVGFELRRSLPPRRSCGWFGIRWRRGRNGIDVHKVERLCGKRGRWMF
jgi:hypothetical protein